MVNIMLASGRVEAFPEGVTDVLHMIVTEDCVVPARLLAQKLEVKIKTISKLSIISLSVLITRIADEVKDYNIMVYTNNTEIAKTFKKQNVLIDDITYFIDSKVLAKTSKTVRKKSLNDSISKKNKDEKSMTNSTINLSSNNMNISLDENNNDSNKINENLTDYYKLGLEEDIAKAAKDAIQSSTEKEIGFPTKLRMNLALIDKIDVYESTLKLLKPHYDKLKGKIL